MRFKHLKSVILALLLGACATTQTPKPSCTPPEVIMQPKGEVLGCLRVLQEGDWVTKCWIIPKGGHFAVMKTVFKPHCGQYD